jgi:hypothetical protein
MQLQLEQVKEAKEANYIMFTETVESLMNKKAQSLTEEMIGLTMNKLYPMFKTSSYLGEDFYIINNQGKKCYGHESYLDHAYIQ